MAQCIAPTRVLWRCSARDPATLSTCTVMVLLLPKKVVSFCYFSSKRNLNNLHSAFSLLLLVSKRMFPWMCLLLTDNIGSVFLIVDSLLLFVMCTVTLQRLRDCHLNLYIYNNNNNNRHCHPVITKSWAFCVTGKSFNAEERQCRSRTPVPGTAASRTDQAVRRQTGTERSRTWCASFGSKLSSASQAAHPSNAPN